MTLVLLAACGPRGVTEPRQPIPRIEPTNTTPGIHISGSATVGVVRSF